MNYIRTKIAALWAWLMGKVKNKDGPGPWRP